ncbi:MAG: glutathione S-transferase [Sneathiellaceae bacterium]
MITVHHLNDSRSQRILWLLEELGQSYGLVQYKRNSETNLAPPELKQIHPLGKSPVITDDGQVIAESGAIVEYLAHKYGNGRYAPTPDSADYPRHLHWMHFAEGSAMLPFLLNLYVSRLGEAGAPLQPRIQAELANHLGYLDGALKGTDYLMGAQPTAPDFLMSFVAEIANAYGLLGKYPAVAAYLARIQARPAYRAALERGGPYRFAN